MYFLVWWWRMYIVNEWNCGDDGTDNYWRTTVVFFLLIARTEWGQRLGFGFCWLCFAKLLELAAHSIGNVSTRLVDENAQKDKQIVWLLDRGKGAKLSTGGLPRLGLGGLDGMRWNCLEDISLLFDIHFKSRSRSRRGTACFLLFFRVSGCSADTCCVVRFALRYVFVVVFSCRKLRSCALL